MKHKVSHTFISGKPDEKKVLPPTYVRRLGRNKYEYGHILIDFSNRERDAHLPTGTATTYDEACQAMSMLPAQPHVPADLRPVQ